MTRMGMSAPTFALATGILYVALGTLAMIASLVVPAEGTVQYGYFLGLFAVNTPLNAAHAFMGMWGLVAWSGALGAVTYARAVAVVMGILALAGLVPGARNFFDVLPLHGHNVWLHGLSAIAAAWIGWRSLLRHELEAASALKKSERASTGEAWRAGLGEDRRRGVGDRRREARPVAVERRRGAPERRQARYGGGTLAAG